MLTDIFVIFQQAIPDDVGDLLVFVQLVGVLDHFAVVWEHFYLNCFRGDRQVWRHQPLLVLHLELLSLVRLNFEVHALFVVSLPDVLDGLLLGRKLLGIDNFIILRFVIQRVCTYSFLVDISDLGLLSVTNLAFAHVTYEQFMELSLRRCIRRLLLILIVD